VDEEAFVVHAAWRTTSSLLILLLLQEFVAPGIEIFVDEEDDDAILFEAVITGVTWSRSQLSRGVMTDA